jgi:hypothetical protein
LNATFSKAMLNLISNMQPAQNVTAEIFHKSTGIGEEKQEFTSQLKTVTVPSTISYTS